MFLTSVIAIELSTRIFQGQYRHPSKPTTSHHSLPTKIGTRMTDAMPCQSHPESFEPRKAGSVHRTLPLGNHETLDKACLMIY